MNETMKSLMKAFIGESQARNRYIIYGKIAKKEGYEQIAGIFFETGDNEKEHAQSFWDMLQDLKKKEGEEFDKIALEEVDAPAKVGDTATNIRAAIEGEHEENSELYPDFADIAEEEGYPEIAKRIRAIAKAEEHHEERYRKLLEQVEEKTFFKKEKKVYWVCRECGYIHEGEEPPEECPSCLHSKAYFQRKCEEY
jgi:rubrerythrin